MLQIDHRESHDVDIFLPDPQFLPFLDPQIHDFRFEIQPADYRGDATHLKLAFGGIGEIDFIVALPLSTAPTTEAKVDGQSIILETVPEIITKKVYYRAASLKPRDIFDIAAAGELYADSVIDELQRYPDRVGQALATIAKLNPEFVNRAIAQLVIKDRYKELAESAIDRCREILHRV